ncbi:MAG: methylmalonyl-CoA mutase [Fidelibacterota bacterium]
MSGKFDKARDKWLQIVKNTNQRDYNFDTVSGDPVKLLYCPENGDESYLKDLGFPGEFPFTRGVHPNMYRGRLWTMRQFAGFGTPAETNNRFKFLLKNGQTGLSVAYDMPTLMGYDCDHEIADGEVGKCGVAISSLKDMEELFEGIPLDKVSVSQTINGPSVILLAFYIAVAEKQGVDSSVLRGTLQNDILKEYIAQKEWIYPPRESMKIITDMIEYCTEKLPKYNTISISGYHIREAGSTAAQELAFTLADGFTYVEHALERGLDIDKFAPRLSFFFNSHLDFFEEIAKFRAARRIWAKRMRDKYGAKDPKSWKLRFHTQTAGFSLTAQQPENNIARTAFQALAAVLGGTQSLHTNSMDETHALPSEKAAEIALRTQQLIAYETGVSNVIDPLGGSWYVEELTDRLEEKTESYFKQIEDLGGVIPAIEQGFLQREIAEAASAYQKLVDEKKRIVVGVNEFINEQQGIEIPILEIGSDVERKQIEKLNNVKRSRNNEYTQKCLQDLTNAARTNINVMPDLIECAKSYATLGEMVNAMKVVYGEWTESSVI